MNQQQAKAKAEELLPAWYFVYNKHVVKAREDLTQALLEASGERDGMIDSRDRRIDVLLRVVQERDAEIAGWKKVFGNFAPQQAGDFWNQKRDEMYEEITRLSIALLKIGERAVVDFDDATVGEIDKAVPQPHTYGEALKAEYQQVREMRTEFAGLRASLEVAEKRAGEAEIRGMNAALSIVARFEVPGDEIFDAIQSAIAEKAKEES